VRNHALPRLSPVPLGIETDLLVMFNTIPMDLRLQLKIIGICPERRAK
jgi:hypothetical protein